MSVPAHAPHAPQPRLNSAEAKSAAQLRALLNNLEKPYNREKTMKEHLKEMERGFEILRRHSVYIPPFMKCHFLLKSMQSNGLFQDCVRDFLRSNKEIHEQTFPALGRVLKAQYEAIRGESSSHAGKASSAPSTHASASAAETRIAQLEARLAELELSSRKKPANAYAPSPLPAPVRSSFPFGEDEDMLGDFDHELDFDYEPTAAKAGQQFDKKKFY